MSQFPVHAQGDEGDEYDEYDEYDEATQQHIIQMGCFIYNN